jgi:nitroreductase
MIASLQKTALPGPAARSCRRRSLVRRTLRQAGRLLARFTFRVAEKSPLLSSIYFALFSRAFRREHRAVLSGLLKYEEESDRPTSSSALLRRNIHRLEKGLLMRPRRALYALDYIRETVACYQGAATAVDSEEASQELHWAHDVLETYFGLSKPHPVVDAARAAFQQACARCAKQAVNRTPYKRDLSAAPAVSYEALRALAHRRRSVRWFLQKPVPRETIDKAILIASQSPSACNRQPFVFRVIDDPAILRRAASIPMGTAGFADNIPVMVVVVGQQRHFFNPRDRHLIYVDGALAAMGFIYGAEVQGLSTCCINWPEIKKKETAMARLLDLQPDERPVMCMAVGYPDPEGLVGYSQRKPLDRLRKYNLE